MSDDVLATLGAQRLPEPPPLSAALEAELANLAPVAPRRPMRQLAAFVTISLVYAAALLAILTPRRDLGELPIGWIAGAGCAWLLGFALPCYFALVPRAGSMTPRRVWAIASAAVTSIAFVALGLAMHPIMPSSKVYGWDHFARGHTCLELGVATAIMPVVIGAMFLRGALPVGSRWIAASLGAGGGCLGGLLLHFHCPIADGPHIGLMHGGVVVVAAALSATFVPRATDRPLR